MARSTGDDCNFTWIFMPSKPQVASQAENLQGVRPVVGGVSQLMIQLQAELRQIAGRELQGERKDHILQPTALVNEAFVRLAHQHNLQDATRTDFLAAAAQTMRRILVDYARARQTNKRGDDWIRVTLSGLNASEENSELEIIALNDALEGLKLQNERMAAVVELRYFAGMTVQETADSLGISVRTVADDWVFARAWLKRAMAS